MLMYMFQHTFIEVVEVVAINVQKRVYNITLNM